MRPEITERAFEEAIERGLLQVRSRRLRYRRDGGA
jgi:hypothetical protein